MYLKHSELVFHNKRKDFVKRHLKMVCDFKDRDTTDLTMSYAKLLLDFSFLKIETSQE